jgi:hypothetical protein
VKTIAEQKAWEFEGMPEREAYSRAYWVKGGDTLLKLVRETVQTSGDKQGAGFAQDLAVNPTQFSEALKDAGKHFSIKWLVRVMAADRERRILRFLAGLFGYEIRPRLSMTPQEIAQRLVSRLAEREGTGGKAILTAEFGPEFEQILAALSEVQP